MVSTQSIPLPHGIDLHCRVSGPVDGPVLLFLHGFPEGPFIWDPILEHLADPANGGFRCAAPALRGYAPSSQPAAVDAYRARHLVQDITALIDALSPRTPLAGLIAHDWGGAVAWNVANQFPQRIARLAIVNSPHPGTFLRELQHNAAQQAASQYMHFLCRPDAEALLAEDGYRRLFAFFDTPAGTPPAWLDEATRAQYRVQWDGGLAGPCNYYRASPLRPPRGSDAAAQAVALPDAMLRIDVPTLVLWGLDDPALLPGLVDGLEAWIPRLDLQRIAGASHWIVHEQPAVVAARLQAFLQSN